MISQMINHGLEIKVLDDGLQAEHWLRLMMIMMMMMMMMIIIIIKALFIDGNHVITNDFQWDIIWTIICKKR